MQAEDDEDKEDIVHFLTCEERSRSHALHRAPTWSPVNVIMLEIDRPDYRQLLQRIARLRSVAVWKYADAALEQALLRGHADAVCCLLTLMADCQRDAHIQGGGPANFKYGYLGRTPEQLAYYCGHAHLLEVLSEIRPHYDVAFARDGPEEKTLKGWKLRQAVRLGSFKQVKAALKAEDINSTDSFGRSALFFSCLLGYPEKAEFLVKHGANAFQVDSIGGETPLSVAAYRKHSNVVKVLIHSLSCSQTDNPASKATEEKNYDMNFVKLKRAITIATAREDLQSLTALLEHAGPRFFGGGLRAAVQANFREELAVLLKWCDFSRPLSQPIEHFIELAAGLGRHRALSELLTYTQQSLEFCASHQVFPLHSAVQGGNLQTVSLLVAAGCSVNLSIWIDNRSQMSPLHYAAQNNQPHMARLLLEMGANPHQAVQCATPPATLARSKKNFFCACVIEQFFRSLSLRCLIVIRRSLYPTSSVSDAVEKLPLPRAMKQRLMCVN